MKKYFCIDFDDFNTMNKYGKVEFLKRYSFLALALLIMAFGCSLSIRANLGCTPISCPPYVLSCIPEQYFSFGALTVIMHLIFVFIQWILLRRDFNFKILLQIPLGLNDVAYQIYAVGRFVSRLCCKGFATCFGSDDYRHRLFNSSPLQSSFVGGGGDYLGYCSSRKKGIRKS